MAIRDKAAPARPACPRIGPSGPDDREPVRGRYRPSLGQPVRPGGHVHGERGNEKPPVGLPYRGVR